MTRQIDMPAELFLRARLLLPAGLEQLFLNVLQQLDRARRGIILYHDIHEQTVIVLPHLLQELRVRGFKTVVFVRAAA